VRAALALVAMLAVTPAAVAAGQTLGFHLRLMVPPAVTPFRSGEREYLIYSVRFQNIGTEVVALSALEVLDTLHDRTWALTGSALSLAMTIRPQPTDPQTLPVGAEARVVIRLDYPVGERPEVLVQQVRVRNRSGGLGLSSWAVLGETQVRAP
jgi:hypothetical protein